MVLKSILSSVAFVLLTLFASAQDVAMADELRSNGKIYVVVFVVVIIFLGIIAYLLNLDRKISRIEKKMDK